MKRSFIAALTLLFASWCSASPATDATLQWLGLIDSGQYAQSWSQAAKRFQAQTSRSQWQLALQQVRAPLGKVLERKITASNSKASLPGAPDGEYQVITLSTRYQHKASATETVTLAKQQGGWKVVGYFIN